VIRAIRLISGDVAAVVVVETEAEARRRGARIVAAVRQTLEWRGDAPGWKDLVAPSGQRSEVVLARADGGSGPLLDASAWSGCAHAR